MRDYSGKSVFVGIDVHKKRYVIVAICEGEVVKKWSTPANARDLSGQLKKYFRGAKIKTAYEAGFSGFCLHRILEEEGINSQVVNPGSIKTAARDRVKTDKRDAQKIAQQLSSGDLKGIYVPSIAEEKARLLTRTRASLVKEKVRIGHQIKSKLYQFGLIPEDSNRSMNLKWIHELRQKDLGTELNITIEVLSDIYIEINKRIRKVNDDLRRQAKEQKELEEVYRSVPGIGAISARELSNELGDMSRFKNERQLFSYLGLTPQEHSSGEYVRLGHISRCGGARLRRILVEASWVAIRYDKSLEAYYKHLSRRAGGKRAIVAVSRKLAGRIRTCFQKQELFQAQENAA